MGWKVHPSPCGPQNTYLEAHENTPNMARNAATEPASVSKKLEYDPELTEQVIAATGPKAHPRLAQIMPSLIRHLHDFAREVDLTVDEWAAGVQMVSVSLLIL